MSSESVLIGRLRRIAEKHADAAGVTLEIFLERLEAYQRAQIRERLQPQTPTPLIAALLRIEAVGDVSEVSHAA